MNTPDRILHNLSAMLPACACRPCLTSLVLLLAPCTAAWAHDYSFDELLSMPLICLLQLQFAPSHAQGADALHVGGEDRHAVNETMQADQRMPRKTPGSSGGNLMAAFPPESMADRPNCLRFRSRGWI